MTESRLFEVESTFSVGELADQIGRSLRRQFPDEVWVKGQIRNLSKSRAGHCYFDLVDPVDSGRDPEATIPVVLFDSSRQIVNRILAREGAPKMEDGVELRLRGEVEFYSRQGRTQIRMTSVDAEYTLGKLAADRERLLAELRDTGLLSRNSGLPLPLVPLNVGLVTSAGSAAAADFLTHLDAGSFSWRVVLVDTQVQGLGADHAIAAGLRRAGRATVDVIALVRGGGSRTELAPFDARTVAYAIAESPVPVLTGVGHETDQSVADLVSHTAVKTPTACAQLLAETVAHYLAEVETSWARVAEVAGLQARMARQQINDRGEAALRFARRAVVGPRQRSDETAERLARAARRHPPAALRDLDHLATRLRLLDPSHTLARGWSITRTSDGAVLRSAGEVQPGEQLTTQLADGTIRSTVEDTQ